MKLSISVLLLLSVIVLATPSEVGWIRKVLGKVGDTTKKVAENASTIKGMVDLVSKYGPLVMQSMGGDSTPQADRQARSLMGELELQCPVLFNKGRPMGLTLSDLFSAFQATDGNKNRELNGNELGLFQNTLEAVQHCLDILKKQ